MATDPASIEEERSRKLKELFFLFSNPLQSLDSFKKSLSTPTARQFFAANDISLGKRLLISALPRVHDYESLKREIANTVQAEIYQSGSKRSYDGSEQSASKAHKTTLTDYPSRLMPASMGEKKKPSGVTSLMSQIDVLEMETNGFLNKNINDLEILSLPEHYPTEIHNVSSLAELYYLTQTLPLIKLLPGSHKILMTEDFELALLEGKIAVLYSRIEELKRQKKWSLRQPIRYYDPFLYTKRNRKAKSFHWDSLLSEAKWMAADFKESSKFKKACCLEIAQAVQDYWSYGKIMCINRKPIRHIGDPPEELTQVETAAALTFTAEEVDEGGEKPDVVEEFLDLAESAEDKVAAQDAMEIDELTEPTADEIQEAKSETVEQEEEPDGAESNVDVLVEENQEDQAEESQDQEIPADDQESVQEQQTEDGPVESEIPDSESIEEPESDAIDVSKLLERPDPSQEIVPPILPEYTAQDLADLGISIKSNSPFKLHVNVNDIKKIDQSIIRNLPKFTAFDDDVMGNMHHAPLKPGENSIIPASRMLYPFDQDDYWYKIVLKDIEQEEPAAEETSGPPEFQKGLFGVSHRRFSYLKPPKPPLIKNIEFRSPTIWLPQDDKHLIHYVAEFCFNWDLIAEHLMAPQASTLKRYESNIERRTPWQCFERYIQLNEKFQFSDMKGHNAYLAQQWLEQAHKAQLTTKRRISPLGVGNESIQRGHRRLRWASMFDAMRKTMRKREAAAAKANTRRSTPSLTTDFVGQGNNSPTYANGASAVKRPTDRIPTPGELSKLKYERDKTIQEAYLNQQSTRSRMMAAVSQLKQNHASAGGRLSPLGPSINSDPGPGAPDLQRRASQIPGRTQLTGTSASNLQRPQTTGGQPQSLQQGKPLIGNIKRPTTPNGTPYTVEQIQQLLQIQKQRRTMQQQNQAGKATVTPTAASSNMQMQGARKLAGAGQGALGQNFTGAPVATGSSSASLPQGASQTKRTVVPPSKGRLQFAPGQVSAIINSIQQKNPKLTKEQVTKLAASYLANLQQQQQSRLEQQQQQQQQQSQQVRQGTLSQQALLARQAQLQRQRMAGKEPETPSLSKLQYEERKKLMMQGTQLPISLYSPSGASSPNFASLSPNMSNSNLAQQSNLGMNSSGSGTRSSSRHQGNNNSENN